jgi:hypothetical protein
MAQFYEQYQQDVVFDIHPRHEFGGASLYVGDMHPDINEDVCCYVCC